MRTIRTIRHAMLKLSYRQPRKRALGLKATLPLVLFGLSLLVLATKAAFAANPLDENIFLAVLPMNAEDADTLVRQLDAKGLNKNWEVHVHEHVRHTENFNSMPLFFPAQKGFLCLAGTRHYWPDPARYNQSTSLESTMSKEIDKLFDSNDLSAAIAVKGMTDVALDAMRRQTDAAIALDEVSRNYKDKQEELAQTRYEQSALRRKIDESARREQGKQSVIMAYAREIDTLRAEKLKNVEALQKAQECLDLARRDEKAISQLFVEQKTKLRKSEEKIQVLETVPQNLAIAFTGALLQKTGLLEKFGNRSAEPQEPEPDFRQMLQQVKKHAKVNREEHLTPEPENQPGAAEPAVPAPAKQPGVAETVAQAEGISIELAQRIIQAADKLRACAMSQLAAELDDSSCMKKPLQIMADIICGRPETPTRMDGPPSEHQQSGRDLVNKLLTSSDRRRDQTGGTT